MFSERVTDKKSQVVDIIIDVCKSNKLYASGWIALDGEPVPAARLTRRVTSHGPLTCFGAGGWRLGSCQARHWVSDRCRGTGRAGIRRNVLKWLAVVEACG